MPTDTTTEPQTIGVVTLDYATDTANCTVHGWLGTGGELVDPESYAELHVSQHPECWADHCGGEGCRNDECVCHAAQVTR